MEYEESEGTRHPSGGSSDARHAAVKLVFKADDPIDPMQTTGSSSMIHSADPVNMLERPE